MSTTPRRKTQYSGRTSRRAQSLVRRDLKKRRGDVPGFVSHMAHVRLRARGWEPARSDHTHRAGGGFGDEELLRFRPRSDVVDVVARVHRPTEARNRAAAAKVCAEEKGARAQE